MDKERLFSHKKEENPGAPGWPDISLFSKTGLQLKKFLTALLR